MVRPGRRPPLKTIAEGGALVGVRLRTLVGKLRQAFLELRRAGPQTIGLAFSRIFRCSVGLGLNLRLRVSLRRMGRATGNQKSNYNDQRTIHGLPHLRSRQVKSSNATGLQVRYG
jgi:hypothetical protein